MFSRLLLLLLLPIVISSCDSTKKISKKKLVVTLDDVEVSPKEYNPSATRTNDLLHTVLLVKFDWQKQHLLGSAFLTLKPYTKPVSTLELDAKGFDILKVGVIRENHFSPLIYQYDSLKLKIDLQDTYAEKDTYQIQIDYIAKPEELPKGGSDAITSDKGLYFINPLGKEKGKPMQIWTQGETEASSCWFPTIDKPNENTTQEIYITVPDTLVTLSNGLMLKSTKNLDGTRTDYWKMDLPHTPYLFMMAIGEFAVVNDQWRNIPVDYYVEKKFEPYAKAIFGDTPEMLELFSKQLGVDYPWQKYAQIAVRDYVSGAMENTTATIHGEWAQQTARELVDGNHWESTIAHEAYHQWFGDFVTCESWANLTLNEGFATYSEYLWAEHKHGIDEAELQRQEMLDSYFGEARYYQEPLIRFYHADKEDMFDSHSYSKGGLVLHMLRKHLGDEIFFKALNIYLKENAFQAVEVHHLRLAFEKASGEDLNWFFNQWYLSPGHPEIAVNYSYNDSTKEISIGITQTQENEAAPVFRLPLAIDIYSADGVKRENVTLENKSGTFVFPVARKPDLVNVDADKNLLCKIGSYKSTKEYAYQYEKAPGYMNKREAILYGKQVQDEDTLAGKILVAALSDKFYGLRKLAVESVKVNDSTRPLLEAIARFDKKSTVRSAAIKRLGMTRAGEYRELYKKSLTDSSLAVAASSLNALLMIDTVQAVKEAHHFEEFNGYRMVYVLGRIYVAGGGESHQQYFERKIDETTGWSRGYTITSYGEYLSGKSDTIVSNGVKTLEDLAINSSDSGERKNAATAIHDLWVGLDKQAQANLAEELSKALERIIAAEKDAELLKEYESFKLAN